jgi:glycosyltransferase involved in cell wall biosynthesis
MTNVWPGLMDWTWDHAASSARLRRQLGFSEQERRAQHLRQTLSMADALIAPSQFLANFYIRQGVDAGRIHVWRQGVQMPAPITRTSSPELRIGYIGQIKPHKGVDLLVDAWAMLRGDRPRRLLLYGSDSGEPEYGNRIRSTITTLSSAEWRGTYRGSEVWDILAGLDLVVIPSRWVENSPNSILESQAARVPLIGANLGGMSELIRHEHNGLLFEVDNAGSLANQLQRVLDEPKLLPEMRARSIPVRTVEQEVAQLVSLYENLLTHPRTSSPDTVPALSGAQ